MHELPVACHHREDRLEMASIFYGRLAVENATALMHFQKRGLSQKLLHSLKYRGQEAIGTFLGNWLGQELSNHPKYKTVDLVIPVPIHPKKRRRRGYNQVTAFGMEIATHLNASFREDIILKTRQSLSQTFKTRLKRTNTDNPFFTRTPEALSRTHILIVDDVITTGNTLEQCALQVQLYSPAKISFATMAIA